MKIPLSLIRSLFPFSLSPKEIGETLTLLGLEVDRIENEYPSFSGVVSGQILAVRPHPDAKLLQIAEVSDGTACYSVVCAAQNCRKNLKTAFAKQGAILTDRDGLKREIVPTRVRGVESFGMLCSQKELFLGEEGEKIFELPDDFPLGKDLAKELVDPVFEISLTPNLGHCMSALGIARELAAALQKKITPTPLLDFGPCLPFKIEVPNPHLCSHYLCCLIEYPGGTPTPFPIQRTLQATGQKSIHPVVDIVNFVLLQLGQPMHAFDADLLEGSSIRIAPASHSFPFLGLDGIKREVPQGTLCIWDEKKPLAIAGILGGLDSAVTPKTKRVLLEAAHFDPLAIRKTARLLGLRTESSQRFEKGVDPQGLKRALSQVVHLLNSSIQGHASFTAFEEKRKALPIRPKRINALLGTKLSETEIEEIFIRLEFEVEKGKAIVPSYRHDVTQQIDLVEEVARIYGYNRLEKPLPRSTLSPQSHDPMFLFENEMREKLVAQGLTEMLTCDLISPRMAEICQQITDCSFEPLQAKYAKSEEYSFLRTSLLPNLLQVIERNFAQKNHSIAAFEIGRIHFLQKRKPIEIPMLAILLTGKKEDPNWRHPKGVDFDFFDLKAILESLFSAAFRPSEHRSFHPQRQADVWKGDQVLGSLGELHPLLLKKFGLEERVWYAELNLASLLQIRPGFAQAASLPVFPSSERDWTIALSLREKIGDLLEKIRSLPSLLLERCELIDLYTPEGMEERKATFRFFYRDPLKTISFEEVEEEHSKIVSQVRNLLAK